MPQLADLQRNNTERYSQPTTRNAFDGEETLVVDARSKLTMAHFVEDKFRRLVTRCAEAK